MASALVDVLVVAGGGGGGASLGGGGGAGGVGANGTGGSNSAAGGAGGFLFGTDITELEATESGKRDLIGCVYNAALDRWLVVAVVKGFTV